MNMEHLKTMDMQNHQKSTSYDVERFNEYIRHTLSAILLLFMAGFLFESVNATISVVIGVIGLIFAVVVIYHYYTLIQAIDEIEGFFSHFGVIYCIKFSVCVGSGVALSRHHYAECLCGIFIVAILSFMLVYGYRDMLREHRRSGAARM